MKKYIICIPVFLSVLFLCLQCSTGPNSKYRGVQIGTVTYSYRDMPGKSIHEILDYTLQNGINTIELMGNTTETYAGIPVEDGRDAIREWRSSVSMDKYKEIRSLFESKGVKIHLLNMCNASWSDEEIDYAFNVCKALGAKGLAMEVDMNNAKRLSHFAEKHKLYVVLHNHGQARDPNFNYDHYLSCGERVMLNLDVGHYYGATGRHPNEVIKKYHARMFSIHLKDKTSKDSSQPDQNRSFGKGDTPIRDILHLIRDEKWPIYCDIEMEYDVPENSNPVLEVKKCVDYCRAILIEK